MTNITRRNLIGLAGAGMALAAVAGSGIALAEAETLFIAGTYTATAAGRNGDVTVTVTFSDDAITDVSTEHEETPTIGGAAIETLTSLLLEAQALDLDIVSGATMSSEAFLTAVTDCVEQAGADPSLLVGASEVATEYVTSADVIIIGAGGAGMTAAVTAAEEGATVILLEKSGVVGGNSVMTSNGINAVDAAIQLADEDYVASAPEGGFKELTMSMNEQSLESYPEAETCSEELVDAYVANSGEMIDWLVEKGLTFELSFSEDFRNNSTNYWLLMGGDSMETAPKVIAALEEARKGLDAISLYMNTEVTSLVTDDSGTVTGVVATTPDGEMEFSAASVIICTGGFNANLEMVAEQRPDLANAVIGVRAPTTGDGLVMAEALGAATTNLYVMNTFPNFMVDYGMMMMGSLPGGGGSIDCIYVNQDAVRFTAEGWSVADALLENEKSFTIFDDSGMNDTLEAAFGAGVVKQGDTIAELAEQLGLDADVLATTIDDFNEDIADGVDDAFGRGGSTDPLEPPFYGYHFGAATHYDLGGLKINASTQVLTSEGEVISGLYAAGEVVGNYQGTYRVDGSGIGESLTFGRIAGKTAAAAALA